MSASVTGDPLSDFCVEPLTKPRFVTPLRLTFKQCGKPRAWELVKVHESVGVVAFNSTRAKLLFVRQFRPAVYFNGIPPEERERLMKGEPGAKLDTDKYPVSAGYTLELCAGIVDKPVPLEEIASMEMKEEVGYDVPASSMERVVSLRSSVGVMGDRQTLFYVEVTDDMRVAGGGGGNVSEGERIDVVELTVDEARTYVSGPSVASPAELLFGVQWFLANKAAKFQRLEPA